MYFCYNNHKSLSGIETVDEPKIDILEAGYNNHKSLSGIETQLYPDRQHWGGGYKVIITTNPFQGLKLHTFPLHNVLLIGYNNHKSLSGIETP
jgi:hypothetical protein